MLDTFNTPIPQNANYQEFYGGGTTRDWIKPRGVSMMRILVIGAGGGGCGGSTSNNGYTGGGSGAVTSWIGPAIFVPDILQMSIGAGGAGGAASSTATGNNGSTGGASGVIYQAKDSGGYTLLQAAAGGGGTTSNTGPAGGTAFTNNFFGASGIFTSIAGQAGASRAVGITASTTTFLSGGAGGTNATGSGFNVAVNYGYPTILGGAAGLAGNAGFFITQPIMLGAGGSAGGSDTTGAGGGGAGGNGGDANGGNAGTYDASNNMTSSVTNGAVGPGATRATWAQIRSFMNANCGTNFGP